MPNIKEEEEEVPELGEFGDGDDSDSDSQCDSEDDSDYEDDDDSSQNSSSSSSSNSSTKEQCYDATRGHLPPSKLLPRIKDNAIATGNDECELSKDNHAFDGSRTPASCAASELTIRASNPKQIGCFTGLVDFLLLNGELNQKQGNICQCSVCT